MVNEARDDGPAVIDLGRMSYAAAYAEQVRHVDEVLASRAAGRGEIGRVLLVEHDAVITVTKRGGAAGHVLASAEALARAGVALEETDRGGDVTYHGPGQLVVYPIVDLNRLNLGLHEHMRLLEGAVIAACGAMGVPGQRDAGATGVWVTPAGGGAAAKVCAMGVRVRRWVTMHGLALNVDPAMAHFGLIVPCGLHGRAVTSLAMEARARGIAPPTMAEARRVLAGELSRALREAADRADDARHLAERQTGAAGDDAERPRFVC